MSRGSWQNRALCALFRLTMHRNFTSAEKGERMLARAKGPSGPSAALLRRHPVSSRQIGGYDVHVVEPVGGVRNESVVVYLHGGSYIKEAAKQHWALIGDLAEATGSAVQVPIYPLAPEVALPRMVDFVVAVVRSLDAVKVQLVGDSAGGGLALLTAQRLRDEGASPVDSVVVMAPWLDLAMDNPAIDEIERVDPWLARPAMRPIAAAVAGGLDVEDPRVSPVRGDLSGLPPVTVHVGTRDMTLADCRLLVERVRAADGVIELHESPGSPHVHPLLPTPEGRAARRELIATVVAASR